MRNARQTNRRFGEEWYECQRCGEQYPRRLMLSQNGLIVCTVRCVDQPGRNAYVKHWPIRREENPPPLPEQNEDL